MVTRKTKHINTLLEIQQPGYIICEAKFLVKVLAFHVIIYMFWPQGNKQSSIYVMHWDPCRKWSHFADVGLKCISLKKILFFNQMSVIFCYQG